MILFLSFYNLFHILFQKIQGREKGATNSSKRWYNRAMYYFELVNTPNGVALFLLKNSS